MALFQDESGQGLRLPKGRTWGRRGQTPVVTVTGGHDTRVSLAALIAVRPGCRPRLIFRACARDSLPHTHLVSRTSITRLSRKASSDRAALDRLLDTVRIGHFAIVTDDTDPVVLPTAVVRDGDRVLAHGSTGSRWLRRLAAGAPACLAVTAFDALVMARSAFESSMRYRSAVLFGQCRAITEQDAKRRALEVITDALIPGRTAEVRPSTAKELAAVLVLALPIAEWSLKVSEGWPDDPPDDVAGPAWAGVLPVMQRYEQPLAAPDLRDGVPLPASVTAVVVRDSCPPSPLWTRTHGNG